MHLEQFMCDECQCTKLTGPGHSLLPDWDVAGAPWEEVAVDLVVSWHVITSDGDVEFFALKCNDTTTNLVKLTRIFEKSSNHVASCFEHN